MRFLLHADPRILVQQAGDEAELAEIDGVTNPLFSHGFDGLAEALQALLTAGGSKFEERIYEQFAAAQYEESGFLERVIERDIEKLPENNAMPYSRMGGHAGRILRGSGYQYQM